MVKSNNIKIDIKRAAALIRYFGVTTSRVLVQIAEEGYPAKLTVVIGIRSFRIRLVASPAGEKIYSIKREGTGRSISVGILTSSPLKNNSICFFYFVSSQFPMIADGEPMRLVADFFDKFDIGKYKALGT